MRPRDPVMELHRVARSADVTALAHEGAAAVVAIVDLTSNRGGDVLALARHTRPRFRDYDIS
jgi:hypothetical protein